VTALRLGTRGSDLARRQTEIVTALLREHAGAEAEEVIISTKGDREAQAPMAPGTWSPGAFVTEIERALRDAEVDLAVHSYKDMATAHSPGLAVVATPERAPVFDLLIFGSAEQADAARDALQSGERFEQITVGTSSPRRAAQIRRALGCCTEPIRGNVPTRLSKIDNGYDAVCLAGAGLHRLGIDPPHTVVLPVDRFPTAPAQGAIAVQGRVGTEAAAMAETITHAPTRVCVEAERNFLREINAGCHTAAAANATEEAGLVRMHVQYFTPGEAFFEATFAGSDPTAVGGEAGREVLAWLENL
jgi:hydroxymethylbilane synthase